MKQYVQIYRDAVTGAIIAVDEQDTPFSQEMTDYGELPIPVTDYEGNQQTKRAMCMNCEIKNNDEQNGRIRAREILENCEVNPAGKLVPRPDATSRIKNKMSVTRDLQNGGM